MFAPVFKQTENTHVALQPFIHEKFVQPGHTANHLNDYIPPIQNEKSNQYGGISHDLVETPIVYSYVYLTLACLSLLRYLNRRGDVGTC